MWFDGAGEPPTNAIRRGGKGMRRLFGIVLVAVLAFGLTIPASAAGATRGTRPLDQTVPIKGWRFHPKVLTITVGETVTWVNEQKGHHTSISDDGVTWNSGAIPSGGTFTFTFTQAGTYPYHCKYGHGIHGTIVVNP
jgi:plastocyanin